jgi:hypothetical protein
MSHIQLLHNDDEVLDPTDPALRARGSVLIDGKEYGSWESRTDGSWSAWLHPVVRLDADSSEALKAAIAAHHAR